MKNVLTAMLLLLSMQSALSQSSKVKTVDIQTEIFCDHCLQCESCDQNIYSKVKANTKGVRSIKVNANSNIITVKFNSEKTTIEEIEKAITLAGFKANEQKPSIEAYNSLDGCCKKK